MNDNIDESRIRSENYVPIVYVGDEFNYICEVFDEIRISHFLPKSREQLWIECANKLAEIGEVVMGFAFAMGVYALATHDTTLVLRKGAFQVIAICISRYIDPSTNCLVFGKTSLPERAFYTTDMEERDLVSCIFNFAKDIADLKLSPEELGVYSGLIFYNDVLPGLRFPDDVTDHKNFLMEQLKIVLDVHNRQPLENGVTVYDALIAKIPELRLIGHMYHDAVVKFERSHPHIELSEFHQWLFGGIVLRATAA